MGIEAIKNHSLTALTKLRRGYIVALAEANNVLPGVNISSDPLVRLYKADQVFGKMAYAQALIDWVSLLLSSETASLPPF